MNNGCIGRILRLARFRMRHGNKWQRSWVAYAELADQMKETDRVWARKVVKLLRQRGLIP